eukprot:COSAG02_NODE_13188_length_1430_cov_0.777611_2_plen_127_part_00
MATVVSRKFLLAETQFLLATSQGGEHWSEEYHGLERGTSMGVDDGGGAQVQTPALRDRGDASMHDLAARASEALAMLDDASFVARMQALCRAYVAYTQACQGKGWTYVSQRRRFCLETTTWARSVL